MFRFLGHTFEPIKAAGNFLNYDLSWEKIARIAQDLEAANLELVRDVERVSLQHGDLRARVDLIAELAK